MSASQIVRLVMASVVVLVIAASLAFPGSTAAAQALSQKERQDGLWYMKALKLDDIHKSGITGKGVTVAIFDSPINPNIAELKGADITVTPMCKDIKTGKMISAVTEKPDHASSVASMIVGRGVAGDGGLGTKGVAPGVKLLVYSEGDVDKERDDASPYHTCNGIYPEVSKIAGPNAGRIANSIVKATLDGADIISFSFLAEHDVHDGSINRALAFAAKKGVAVVSGAPNPTNSEGMTSFKSKMLIPTSRNGVVAVNAADSDGVVIGYDAADIFDFQSAPGAYNLAVMAPGGSLLAPTIRTVEGEKSTYSWGAGSIDGTSFATPITAGVMALAKQKYPNATMNQIIQALIRTTGGVYKDTPQWHDVRYGYGHISPATLLATDPTQFPDENPLFIKYVSDPRCNGAKSMSDCEWATAPTSEDFKRIYEMWDKGIYEMPGDRYIPPHVDQSWGILEFVIIGSGAGVVGLILFFAVIRPVSKARKRRKAAGLGTASAGVVVGQQAGYQGVDLQTGQQGVVSQAQPQTEQGYVGTSGKSVDPTANTGAVDANNAVSGGWVPPVQQGSTAEQPPQDNS